MHRWTESSITTMTSHDLKAMAIGKAVNFPDVAGRGNGSCPSPRARTIICSLFVSLCTDLVFGHVYVVSVVVCDDLGELMEQRFSSSVGGDVSQSCIAISVSSLFFPRTLNRCTKTPTGPRAQTTIPLLVLPSTWL